MRVEHQLQISGICPINGVRDSYVATVRIKRMLTVEEIIERADNLSKSMEPMFQEQLTQALADLLCAEVETVGYHSGVRTTVVCGEAQ